METQQKPASAVEDRKTLKREKNTERNRKWRASKIIKVLSGDDSKSTLKVSPKKVRKLNRSPIREGDFDENANDGMSPITLSDHVAHHLTEQQPKVTIKVYVK